MEKILDEILSYADEKRVLQTEKFLQTQLGGYGYGNKIVGVQFPILRGIAKKYQDITFDSLEKLFQNEWHEARFVALVILIYKFKKFPKNAFQIYFDNIKFIDNWDLVDISAHHIVGEYCFEIHDDNCIWDLAKSQNLWEERIAIVSSWAFIKRKDVSLTIKLCEHFMNHKHHLIHKACGWMLREVGKKDKELLVEFLKKYKNNLPRITISYAKELLAKKESFSKDVK